MDGVDGQHRLCYVELSGFFCQSVFLHQQRHHIPCTTSTISQQGKTSLNTLAILRCSCNLFILFVEFSSIFYSSKFLFGCIVLKTCSGSYLLAGIPWWGRDSSYPGSCRTFSPPTDCLPLLECPAQHGCDQPTSQQTHKVSKMRNRHMSRIPLCVLLLHLFFLQHVSFAEDFHGIHMTGVFFLHQANLK